MDISRRTLLAGAGVAASLLPAPPAQGLSLIDPIMQRAFSDAACRKGLREFVALIGKARIMTDDALSEAVRTLHVQFDSMLVEELVTDPVPGRYEQAEVIRALTISFGQRDRSPARLHEVNLLKGRKGFALYQFTLRRDAYFPEVSEEEPEQQGDQGGPIPPHYSDDDTSFLGLFFNNQLRRVSGFDIWLEELNR